MSFHYLSPYIANNIMILNITVPYLKYHTHTHKFIICTLKQHLTRPTCRVELVNVSIVCLRNTLNPKKKKNLLFALYYLRSMLVSTYYKGFLMLIH